MRDSIPTYRNRTLLKDVLDEYPNIIDFNLPNLEGLTDETAISIKQYLYERVTSQYRYSEISTYYAYDFVNYFQNRWYTKIVKYAPVLKAKLHTEENINTGEDFTAEKTVDTTDTAGKKVSETYNKDETRGTTYGRTVDNTTQNTNKGTVSDEATNTRNNTENTTNNTEENSGGTSTQYERQIVSDARTSGSEQTGERSVEETVTAKNTETTNTEQNGTYKTVYGGSDSETTEREDTREITNSGTDNISEKSSQNYKRLIFDYGRIDSMLNAPDIVERFIAEFYNLFMEVFV